MNTASRTLTWHRAFRITLKPLWVGQHGVILTSRALCPCQPSGAIWRHTYSAAVTTLTDTACTHSGYSDAWWRGFLGHFKNPSDHDDHTKYMRLYCT